MQLKRRQQDNSGPIDSGGKGRTVKRSWRKAHRKICSSETGPAGPSVCLPIPALGDQTCVLEHMARAIYIFMVFLRINSSLNITQDNAKIVAEVTSWAEIWEVIFILVFSYREHFHVNNLCLIKMSLSELGASLKNGSNTSVLHFISPVSLFRSAPFCSGRYLYLSYKSVKKTLQLQL